MAYASRRMFSTLVRNSRREFQLLAQKPVIINIWFPGYYTGKDFNHTTTTFEAMLKKINLDKDKDAGHPGHVSLEAQGEYLSIGPIKERAEFFKSCKEKVETKANLRRDNINDDGGTPTPR